MVSRWSRTAHRMVPPRLRPFTSLEKTIGSVGRHVTRGLSLNASSAYFCNVPAQGGFVKTWPSEKGLESVALFRLVSSSLLLVYNAAYFGLRPRVADPAQFVLPQGAARSSPLIDPPQHQSEHLLFRVTKLGESGLGVEVVVPVEHPSASVQTWPAPTHVRDY